MKKSLIILLALTAFLSSCKKSNSSSSASITASVNGVNKNFSNTALAVEVKQAFGAGIVISGLVSIATGESISVSIDNFLSGDTLVAGTYSDTSSRFTISLSYSPNNSGSGGYVGGTSTDGWLYFGGTIVTNHIKLIITSITNTSIKGSFSGNLYLNGDPTNPAFPIANGVFNLNLAQR